MIRLIYRENEWIEETPTEGDLTRDVFDNSSYVEYIWCEPQVEQVKAIRTITKRAFMQRFLQSERIAIRKSDDDIVIDISEDLKLASYVDLDDVGVAQAVDYLVAVGLVAQATKAKLFADGEERESV